MALFINAGQMRNERRKKEKAIKKKARIMTRTNKIMEKTDTTSDLNAKCSTSQSSLDSANRAFGILKRKYQTLKELMSQSCVVLGQGRFGVCKLMSLSASGELLKLQLSIILN